MNRFLGSALILAALATPAFAAKNSATLTISEPVTVAATKLPPAEYKVSWTGSGSNTQVTLTSGKTSVTVPAKATDEQNRTSSILTNSKGGTNALETIYLNHVTLQIISAPTSGQ